MPARQIVLTVSVILISPAVGYSSDKKSGKSKPHPGRAHLEKFVKLAQAGKLKAANELAKPKGVEEAFQRALAGVGKITSKDGKKLELHEIWASDATAWGAFPASQSGGLRGGVLTIFAKKSAGKWYVEHIVVYRPASWERDRKRYEREYKAKRIYLAKKKEK